MKLGSLKNGRDGTLVVVSEDLSKYVAVPDIAPTLQSALESWVVMAPKLQNVYDRLKKGEVDTAKPYKAEDFASPLPRAYQILDGSAYLYHVELVRKARGAEMPKEFLTDPLMYQAVSDTIIAPTDDVSVRDESYGIDYEAEVAVIVDDTPMGVTPDEARNHIKLIMIMNDVSLRGLIPQELGKGFGFVQSKPPSAFAPVAITPDLLGDAWKDGKVHLPIVSHINGEEMGRPNAGVDKQFCFGELVSHAAKTRPLTAGTIIGSGTVSNRDPDSGVSCLAEIRMIEKIETGEFKTPFLSFGDVVKIEMFDKDGNNIFGTIEQEIVQHHVGQNGALQKKAS